MSFVDEAHYLCKKNSSWSGWVQEDKYKIMRFTNGAQCWNGPQRTMQVNMKCGTENKVISVWEPNKCEYEMEMTTPAVCEQ